MGVFATFGAPNQGKSKVGTKSSLALHLHHFDLLDRRESGPQ
jgi:hypothetical protein